MLQAVDLSKSYGPAKALDRLNLEVGPGEIFCLLGANGAGKTTTIHLFLNFIQPNSGKALIDGQDVSGQSLAIKRKLAYLPEQVGFYENLSGLENVAFFCELAGTKRSVEEYLDLAVQAGLSSEDARKPVRAYSKGMRQKIGIAIALARQVDALLLDEPTSGLDPKASNEFCEKLVFLRDQGVATLMATHDIFRAREISNRVGIMKRGRLMTTVDPSSISAQDLESIYLEHMHD